MPTRAPKQEPPTREMLLVIQQYVVIDADCPKCGFPERRIKIECLTEGWPVIFECRQCLYQSIEREA